MVQIDLKKMPLGKLSKKQITSAYGVLTELTKVSDMEKILVPWKAVCVILLHLKLQFVVWILNIYSYLKINMQ